jgi:FKBP-type peptidyl-prolyl cis-trans isomerase FkpA
MSRKYLTIPVLAAALALPVAAQEASAPPVAPASPAVSVPVEGGIELNTEEQKTFYALGVALSHNLTRLDLTANELAYLVAGLEDGVLKREPRVVVDEYAMKVQELAQARFAAVAEREAAAGKQFVDEMAAREGATQTESGIVLFSLQEGQGAAPVATDVVRVHYTGTLQSGEKFDSSVDRGEPVSFPLDQVIPCWTEALQKIKVGGRARIVCPAELAYGAEGRPGIPPNAPLIFEVELLGIGEAPAVEEPAEPTGAVPPAEGEQEVAQPEG